MSATENNCNPTHSEQKLDYITNNLSETEVWSCVLKKYREIFDEVYVF
jgi:hypothetical protein